jgi:hypothetical protein
MCSVTDAHCHPTDLDMPKNSYDENKLGGIAAMATMVDDQDRVKELGGRRAWKADQPSASGSGAGPRVVACFGRLRALWGLSTIL